MIAFCEIYTNMKPPRKWPHALSWKNAALSYDGAVMTRQKLDSSLKSTHGDVTVTDTAQTQTS